MWSPRHALVILFLGVMAVSLLFGCRAFEPETIIVNRPPETYIIGSPAETSGAYFHFHVYWYGTDEDGFVDRYVWALTDTSVQDVESDDDEEDQRFNPFSNALTLEIGTYTTRTDTVFDFQIGQGANLSYDMTLHVVAIDDRNDFDRTPARLHFFSNALGNPEVDFYRLVDGEEQPFADFDTVAFGEPLLLRWRGSTPNLQAYDPELLAERDTVAPFDDGLLGFKWRIPEESDCDDSQEDCWNPRAFDEATGDSFSFFGDVTELTFLNDGSGDGVFGRKLDAGVIQLLVNTLDVAGVQVPVNDRLMHIKVNYEPDTYILDGETDPVPAHNDPLVYPRYYVFHGPESGWYEFAEGDTVPDRAYVLFKAMGRDDGRDEIENEINQLTFQGRFLAGQFLRGDGAYFPFESTFSDRHLTREWTADDPTDLSADTLGFQVGPFDYDVVMRAVDEQGSPDGTPDTLSFVGNYPPCVQCVEVGSLELEAATEYGGEAGIVADNCYDQSCLDAPTELRIYANQAHPDYDPGDPTQLGTRVGSSSGFIWVNASSGSITLEEPFSGEWTQVFASQFFYVVYLHGKDHPQEYWAPGFAHRRIKAWRYQIDYEGDPTNALADGVGRDNINLLTGFNIFENPSDPNLQVDDLFIDEDTGVWGMVIKVSLPQLLVQQGPQAYWDFITASPPPFGFQCPPFPAGGTDEEILAWQQEQSVQRAYRAWQLTTMQLTPAQISVIAIDQSTCDFRFASNTYHYYDGTRVPDPNGRRCEAGYYNVPPDPDGDPTGIIERGALDLEEFAAYSNDREPVVKNFSIEAYLTADPADPPFVGGVDPPNWISTDKDRRLSAR
ncbi:hypothetical protein GF314_16730 [bacterium]|nr:hypothetical protein [bacterium]